MDTGDDTRTAQWVLSQSDLLYHGKILDLVAVCISHANPKISHDEMDKKLTYFRNNSQRMQYADFQPAGLPIGRGVVNLLLNITNTAWLPRVCVGRKTAFIASPFYYCPSQQSPRFFASALLPLLSYAPLRRAYGVLRCMTR